MLSNENHLLLAELPGRARLIASDRGLLIVSAAKFADCSRPNLHCEHSDPEFWRQLNLCLPIFVERDIAECQGDTIHIPCELIGEVYDPQFGLSAFLPDIAPYRLRVSSSGSPGSEKFRLFSEFYSGLLPISLEHFGLFVRHGSAVYRLLDRHYAILRTVDQVNNLSAGAKCDRRAVFAFIHNIRVLCSEYAALDSFLEKQVVVLAEKVTIDCRIDQSKRISLFPVIDGVDSEVLQREFLRFPTAQEIYDWDDGRSNVFLVIPSELERALAIIRQSQYLSGMEKHQILLDPVRRFVGRTDLDRLDFKPFYTKVEQHFEHELSVLRAPNTIPSLDAQPAQAMQPFDAPAGEGEQRLDRSKSEEQVVTGGPSFEEPSPENFILPVPRYPNFVRTFFVPTRTSFEWIEEPSKQPVALISLTEAVYERPLSLRYMINDELFSLKEYQKTGVAWLQYCAKLSMKEAAVGGRKGALLADDMGLGKTIQILTFLAWLLESSRIFAQLANVGPTLVVCPVGLLSVWVSELKKYFQNDGRVFRPYVVLHDQELKSYKQADGLLSTGRLSQNKLVITNYHTLKNYYPSFEALQWSAFVIDEAQEIKDPGTEISKCAKRIPAMFRVASTGTPVENRLRDLWSVIDFVQPGLLGDERTFTNNFEKTDGLGDTERGQLSSRLRKVLRFGMQDTYVLRRTKQDELDGLPPRHEILRCSPMTGAEEELHNFILGSMSDGGQGAALSALTRLIAAYQHSCLEENLPTDMPPDFYLDVSPKLRDLMDLLEEIKERQEKVLIFTRLLKMQQILKLVIERTCGIEIDIINGSVKSGSNVGKGTRQALIDKFQVAAGFNAIVLSPEVAGVGITVTEANNVVHYGRWWNPALEAQATDRVYRIGQRREVNVYYPIYTSKHFISYDERLHLLLSRKKALAADFLQTQESLNISEAELLEGLSVNGEATFVLTLERIKRLEPAEIEALASAIWRRQGFDTFLTPRARGGLAAVVALSKSKTLLLAARTLTEESLAQQVAELENMADYLVKELPNIFGGVTPGLVLVSNMVLAPVAGRVLKSRATILDLAALFQLAESHKISLNDVYREERRRLSTLSDLRSEHSAI